MSAAPLAHPVVTLDQWREDTLLDVTDQVRALLRDHGCAWVHTAGGLTTSQFVELATRVADGPLHRGYGDLPRADGDSPVYPSTPYPARERILWHHEAAHTAEWPHLQFFHCIAATTIGGATPTADSRLVYDRLPAELRDLFTRFGLRYIRNFRDHIDVSWQAFYGVSGKAELRVECERQSISLDCFQDGTVRTAFQTSAVCEVDGRLSFANQVLLHHNAAMPAAARAALFGLYEVPEAFPRHVQFGNGAEIGADVIELIMATYDAVGARSPWRGGDVLVIDNRVTAHSRDPYRGERRVQVALGSFHRRPSAA